MQNDIPSSVTQLHLAISKTSAKVVIDCKIVGEKPINAAGNITTDGMEVLGRMVRSRGRRDNSASVRHGCLRIAHRPVIMRCSLCIKIHWDRLSLFLKGMGEGSKKILIFMRGDVRCGNLKVEIWDNNTSGKCYRLHFSITVCVCVCVWRFRYNLCFP